MANVIVLSARLLTGMQAHWRGCRASGTQRVYFANHSSHIDFLLIRACLPPALRMTTRPVAAEEYWDASWFRRLVGVDVFNALLISRCANRDNGTDAVVKMKAALQQGDSLIVFPEGTRNCTDQVLLPLKSGVYHLACACPGTEFVPVWIDNLRRVMPKGEIIPVPLLCTLTFGAPVQLEPGELKEPFLARCRTHLLALAPNLE